MAEQDDELELKKRARRRLVGAATFAILAVAVLPLVMDEQPPPLGADIPIRIPGQDQVYSPPALKAPAGEAPPRVSVPVAADSAIGAAAPAAPTVNEVRPPASQQTAPAKDKAPEPAKQAETFAKASPPVSIEAKRAQSILEGRAEAEAYVILIGAYAESDNVKRLTSKLDDLDIKTYTENVVLPQGKRTRVRAGPFATQNEARAALDKMKRIGVNGVVAAKP